MSGIWQPWQQPKIDERSVQQYDFSANARIRRATLENALDGTDYYGMAFETMQRHLSEDARILSVGSGDGQDEVRWKTEFHHLGDIVCLDLPSKIPEGFMERFYLAQEILAKAGIENVSFIPGNVMDLPFNDGEFDAVVANHMTYHVPDVVRGLLEMRRVLRPDGTFEHLTNGRENATLKHDSLKEMGKILGVDAPRPFSSRFDQQRAAKVMPFFFRLLEPIEQDSYAPIHDEVTLGVFIETLDTYRLSFSGHVPAKEWMSARDRVQTSLWERIKKDGVIYDRVQRGGGVYENSVSFRPINNLLGRLMLDSSRTLKP